MLLRSVQCGLAALSLSMVPIAAYAQDSQGDGTTSGDTKGPGAPPGAVHNAGDQQEAPMAPDALLGDWGGLRPKLDDAGIKIALGYKGEFAANVSGGESKEATETGQLALTGAFDMDKIAGIQGGTLQATITYRHGYDLGAKAGLGVLQQVQEVYGRGQTWRLTELWYQQIAANGHIVIKAGRFPAGDFNTFDCEFMNLTFCGSLAGNIVGYFWYNYPVAQWTGWIKAQSDTAYLKLGVNEDNRNNLDNAFFFSRGGAKGAIFHAEAGWTPTFGGGKLPGHYKAGGWYATSSDPDVLLGIDGRPAALTGLESLQRDGQYGFYIQGQQQLTGSATRDPVSDSMTRTRGLNVFFNFTRADPRTATQLDQEALGLYLSAPFKGRDKDQAGIAIGRTHYNPRAAEALLLATPGSERRRSEYASELYYAAAILPGVSVRPNIQYVIDPGGLDSSTAVVILGTRFDVNF